MLIEMSFSADLPAEKIEKIFGRNFLENFSSSNLELDDLEKVEYQLIGNEDSIVNLKLDGKSYGVV